MADFEAVPLPHRDNYSDDDMARRAGDYLTHIARRHSVRSFSDKPVPREIIEQCIRAAGTAPSGANHQPWHFVCVSNAGIKRSIRIAAEHEEGEFYGGKASQEWLDDLDKLGTDHHKPFLEIAPWLIAVFLERSGADEEGKKRKNYYMSESVGIATGFLLNALHSAGLATLTHTPNPMKFLSQILKRPATERPYMLIVAGHPADDAEVPAAALEKKPLEQIATFLD
ncbi:nitroreductase family protein [Halioglobus japonicus]|uniref:Nitroreductase family protein n=1 Tax=Halioglobus japonicus TaxID=930805 RepID=A0AAP8SQ39_9GAMM|nr:nitroreductase family protein [Halioglobus japonicus]AQA19089.1 nitroreductase family protein [Halioglobus japonicus]PLW87888.1 nitroreductase family protein [Halioglobus japonicus]GHD06029.1 oxidoreductase [Halioglobus japonicus]